MLLSAKNNGTKFLELIQAQIVNKSPRNAKPEAQRTNIKEK